MNFVVHDVASVGASAAKKESLGFEPLEDRGSPLVPWCPDHLQNHSKVGMWSAERDSRDTLVIMVGQRDVREDSSM